ncbi:hypothetical protein Q5Y71_16580 [Microbulbifer sp. 2205BS26-8]|nr:hypothetical protein [Microbulbifer sp. 2205BS26-8]MDP5211277.1 hypothetical protein [Microbulbifer sp. 2205BS26-8]
MLIVNLGQDILLGFYPLFGAFGPTGVAEAAFTGEADSLGMGAVKFFTAEGGKAQYGCTTGQHPADAVNDHLSDSVLIASKVVPPQISGSEQLLER